MCGRKACTLCPTDLRRACTYKDNKTGLEKQPGWIDLGTVYNPSHNMCPTDIAPVLVDGSHFKSTEPRAIIPMVWGTIPPWHKGDRKKHGLDTHNCRIEGVASSKIYKEPLLNCQRCVIICNGFYEWQTTKGAGFKQPYFIYRKQEEGVSILDAESQGPACLDEPWNGPSLLYIAGIFTSSRPQGDLEYSYSMITMESNDHFSWLHHRMPAVLENEQMVQDWLDRRLPSSRAVEMLKKVSCLSWHRVSTLVNNCRNKDTKCNKPIDASGPNASAVNNPLLNWLQRGTAVKRPSQTVDQPSDKNEPEKKPRTSEDS